MAPGHRLGTEGITRASPQAFWSWKLPRDLWRSHGLMEVFQLGHMAWGDSSWSRGPGRRADTGRRLRTLPVLRRFPRQLPRGTHCSPKLAVAKKHPESWECLQHCVDEAAVLRAPCSAANTPAARPAPHRRQAAAQAHAGLPARALLLPGFWLLQGE